MLSLHNHFFHLNLCELHFWSASTSQPDQIVHVQQEVRMIYSASGTKGSPQPRGHAALQTPGSQLEAIQGVKVFN